MRLMATLLGIGAVTLGATLAFAQDAAKVERGKAVYAEQKCKLCHSIAGEGNAKGPLDGVGSKLSAAELKQWLVSPKEMSEKAKATRKPPMKSYSTLSAEDQDALVAYQLTLKSK
jgi:mono/diheme cytochrome c family protein